MCPAPLQAAASAALHALMSSGQEAAELVHKELLLSMWMGKSAELL
jgi:hypothetical protein